MLQNYLPWISRQCKMQHLSLNRACPYHSPIFFIFLSTFSLWSILSVSSGDLIEFFSALDIIFIHNQRLLPAVHPADPAEFAVVPATEDLGNVLSPLLFRGILNFRWTHLSSPPLSQRQESSACLPADRLPVQQDTAGGSLERAYFAGGQLQFLIQQRADCLAHTKK